MQMHAEENEPAMFINATEVVIMEWNDCVLLM